MLNPSLGTNKDKSQETKQSYNAVKKRVHEEFKLQHDFENGVYFSHF